MTDLSWSREAASITRGARPDALERARELVAVYQRRNRLCKDHADMFADPAWHMLLDLFIAARTNREISVSSLCIASLAPQTTALRHISLMVNRGLIVRTPDDEDSRRVFLSLTPSALAMMDEMLS